VSRDPIATERQLAGWWTRVWAYLLDGVITGLPGFVLIHIFPQGSTGRLVGYLLIPIVSVGYAATLIGLYGRTFGMLVLHVRAIHGATGRNLTRREAWIRATTAFALYQLVYFVLLLIEWSEPTGWSAITTPSSVSSMFSGLFSTSPS